MICKEFTSTHKYAQVFDKKVFEKKVRLTVFKILNNY